MNYPLLCLYPNEYTGRKAQALAGIDLHIRDGETVLLPNTWTLF
jgi:hypothetical protein